MVDLRPASSRSSIANPSVVPVDLQIVKSGKSRFLPTWRPVDIQSSPGCIARVIRSVCQLAMRMERLGSMPVFHWAF